MGEPDIGNGTVPWRMAPFHFLFQDSERDVILGARWRIRLVQLMFGSLKVIALDLTEVTRLEALHGVVQELQDIDGGLIGQRRQRDTNGAGMAGHGSIPFSQRLGVARRVVGTLGWAKISK